MRHPAAVRLYESAGYRRAGEVRCRKGVFSCYEKPLSGESNLVESNGKGYNL